MDVEKEINKMEAIIYDVKDELFETNRKVSELDKKSSITEEILKSFNKTSERLEKSNDKLYSFVESAIKTFGEIQATLVEMQSEIKNNALNTAELKSEQKVIGNEIVEINRKFEESEEKNKIDLRDVNKENKNKWLTGTFIGLIIGFVLTSCGIITQFLVDTDIITFLGNNIFNK